MQEHRLQSRRLQLTCAKLPKKHAHTISSCAEQRALMRSISGQISKSAGRARRSARY